MFKKILLYCFLSLILTYLLFDRYVMQFVWVTPNTNTTVFPYIAKVIKELNNGLNHSVLSMKSDGMYAKIVYKNAYGSGFLKNNPMSNDLDYSVGIYLGKYNYDGKNANEIADSINTKMTAFQTQFYSYINDINTEDLYINNNILNTIAYFNDRHNKNVEAISNSIPPLFDKKTHINYSQKTVYDSNGNTQQMLFPFVLKANEILIEDYDPMVLYSTNIKYSDKTRKMLREITIVTDFFVDITKDNETIRAEITSESFTGQRLSLYRRFFVPITFIDNNSAAYLKNASIINDDNTYLEYRMSNFEHHLKEFENLKISKERPIKLFKRILQCTEMVNPIIDKEKEKIITELITKNLNNPKIMLINDYQTALSSLIDITSKPDLYAKIQMNNAVTNHMSEIIKITGEIKDAHIFTDKDMTALENFTNKINAKSKLINSGSKLNEYNLMLIQEYSPIADTLTSQLRENLTDYNTALEFTEYFYTIMKDAGYHSVDICWLDKNLIGIVKDDFTKTIKPNELKIFAKQNNLPDVEYKFIDKSQLSGLKVRYTVWTRYNSTKEEQQHYQELTKKLLDDKKNYTLKRKLVIY